MRAVAVEVVEVDVDSLELHPENPRSGDVGAISQSIKRNGWFGALVAQSSTRRVLVGNHRLIAARQLRLPAVPVHWIDVDDLTARRILLADNRTSDLASYNETDLVALLQTHIQEDDLLGTGWDADDLDDLLRFIEPAAIVETGAEPAPLEPITSVGDLIHLGNHRLICGDTTDAAVVGRLIDGKTLTVVHADPPYGMGKESEGILNDNLYGEKLLKFQVEWWATWRAHMADNASAYIWGTAPDLWRLWYLGGLDKEPDLLFRNEIVWSKGSGMGMASPGEHSYPLESERCLFFMLGEQFVGNQNADDYWDGYEPFRLWLIAERDKAGWSNSQVNDLTCSFMAGHWTTKSQFQIIHRKAYEVLQVAAQGAAFTASYDDLFTNLFPGITEHRRELSAALRERRTTFHNEHEPMTDVWTFGRVAGEDRYDHATPKPVEAMVRIIKTSTSSGDFIGVPFGGTGPEIVAAEQLDRRCLVAEIEPRYCDSIVARWEALTGETAVRP